MEQKLLGYLMINREQYLTREQITKHEMAVNTPFEHFMNVDHPSEYGQAGYPVIVMHRALEAAHYGRRAEDRAVIQKE